jgi:hypothetical protein
MQRSCRAALALVLLVSGCPSQTPEPTGPRPDTACPKELPAGCKVLRDETDTTKNTVEYHVLVPADTKHDPAQRMLEALYRHLMTRRDTEPAALSAYLYTSEAQYTTPPLSPVAAVTKKPGELAPSFENKIPLELWQQVEQALNLNKRFDRKFKDETRKLTYSAEQKTGKVTVKVPFTEGATEEWAQSASFLQVMNNFTDVVTALFENSADTKHVTFIATWKDQEVAHIDVARADYQRLNLREVEEKIGSLHGRAFLELATGRGTDASVSKAHNKRASDEYRKVLKELKGQAVISPQLK